jgi:hypothetical protein
LSGPDDAAFHLPNYAIYTSIPLIAHGYQAPVHHMAGPYSAQLGMRDKICKEEHMEVVQEMPTFFCGLVGRAHTPPQQYEAISMRVAPKIGYPYY